ncbi:MAG: sodium-dependent transporter [Dehalococcoidales bacterium]
MEVKRERWSSRSLFIFAAIGSAIGLGNVWRFPYMCYEYGGGAFLFAWIVGLIILGIPWLMMEIGLGKYFQKGAPGVFAGIGKKWEWVGWWPVFVAFLIVSYYTVVMAWSLRYAVDSITMAWGKGAAAAEGAADYFFGNILEVSSGPTELGGQVWLTLLMLAIIWIIMYVVMFKGARVLGKVAFWTVLIPWALLVIIFIRGITLPGAVDGLNYYLSTDFSVLADGGVWFAAFSQVAFSLSVGMAGMYAYGSFMAKKSDVNNNAAIVTFSDSATAFFAGFAVFSVVGFFMNALSISAGEVTASGLGLAFITFPAAISMMPALNGLIGVAFFLCLFFLGIDSAFFLAHGGVAAPLRDKLGWSLKKSTIIVCVAGFLLGMLFTTKAGVYWLDMVDRAVSFYGLLITGIISCLLVGWVFGARKLREYLNETSDFKFGAWWDWVIKLVLPIAMTFVVIYGGFMVDIPNAYEGYQVGPFNGSHILWLILGVTLILSFVLGRMATKAPKEEE